jgi:4-oxalocrotonate tautomerase
MAVFRYADRGLPTRAASATVGLSTATRGCRASPTDDRTAPMPIVNIKIAEDAILSDDQRELLIRGATDLIHYVLRKDPKVTFVLIEESPVRNWGLAGKGARQFRADAGRGGFCECAEHGDDDQRKATAVVNAMLAH